MIIIITVLESKLNGLFQRLCLAVGLLSGCKECKNADYPFQNVKYII